MAAEKTVLYIDNSNIFRGCKKPGWRPSYKKVVEYLEREEGPIWEVHFFASEQESPREKQARFYGALRRDLGFVVHACPLVNRKVTCPNCGHVEWVPTEKGVDVCFITHLLRDLKNRAFDTALIMSSDRDYQEAILEVKNAGNRIKIITWRWTMRPEAVRTFRNKNVGFIFLEDHRAQFEKPEGHVL